MLKPPRVLRKVALGNVLPSANHLHQPRQAISYGAMAARSHGAHHVCRTMLCALRICMPNVTTRGEMGIKVLRHMMSQGYASVSVRIDVQGGLTDLCRIRT